jgi:hypothetical protein
LFSQDADEPEPGFSGALLLEGSDSIVVGPLLALEDGALIVADVLSTMGSSIAALPFLFALPAPLTFDLPPGVGDVTLDLATGGDGGGGIKVFSTSSSFPCNGSERRQTYI